MDAPNAGTCVQIRALGSKHIAAGPSVRPEAGGQQQRRVGGTDGGRPRQVATACCLTLFWLYPLAPCAPESSARSSERHLRTLEPSGRCYVQQVHADASLLCVCALLEVRECFRLWCTISGKGASTSRTALLARAVRVARSILATCACARVHGCWTRALAAYRYWRQVLSKGQAQASSPQAGGQETAPAQHVPSVPWTPDNRLGGGGEPKAAV